MYTPTDAQKKKQLELENRQFASPFDFGQTAKIISSKQPEAKHKQEEIEQLPVLEGIRKYAPNHVLLLGKPGSGKSIALTKLLLKEAEKASLKLLSSGNLVKTKIPVLIQLKYYDTSLTSLIEDCFKRHGLLLNSSEIETLLFQKQFLLLIDGLNEVPSSEVIRDLKRFRLTYQATPMIFTTRQSYSSGNLGIEKLLEMQPLTEAQTQKFVLAYLSEKGEQLLKQLKNRLREFSQTPLLLWMLCELFRQREKIPSNLGLIFRQFTQDYEKHLKEDVPVETDRRQWQYLLQHLAFRMMQGKEPTGFRLAISKQEAKEILRQFWQRKVADPESIAIKYLDDLLKYHLIQIGSSEQIEFRHQLLQEYYAAEYLLQKLDDLSNEETKRDYLNYLKWTEPIALMLALVEKEELAERVVQLALEVDLNLAARLAGEVKPEFQEKTVGLIQQLQVPTLLKIQFLERTNSETVVPILIQAMRDKHSRVRSRAVYALQKIKSEKIVPILIQGLNSEDSWIRQTIAKVMGRINSETAVSGLIQALKDRDYQVRQRAAKSLGDIGSEAAVPSLIQALNKEFMTCGHIVQALGKIGSEAAVPSLIQALRDRDYHIRQDAAEALGKIGSEAAVPSLIQALRDRKYGVHQNTVEALRKIGNEKAILSLIDASRNNKDYYVRQDAVKALGKIGSEAAVPSLIQALRDRDYHIRQDAAEALGKIGSEAAVPSLIQALNDTYNVSQKAVFALCKISSETTVSGLVEALNNEKSGIRQNAAKVLGRIGSKTSIPSLVEALSDEDYHVRQSAAEALGKIGSEAAVSCLSKALSDEDYHVRQSAAEALGKIGSEAAVSCLSKALSDEDYRVSRSAAKALGEIGSEKAVSCLSKALNEQESGTSYQAICALEKIGSKKTVSILIEALNVKDNWIRDSVAKALGRIGGEMAVLSLIEAFNDREFGIYGSTAEALGRIGSEKAVPSLIRAFNDKESGIRGGIAKALGRIGSEEAVLSLIEALSDEDSKIRQNAAEALGKIGSEEAVSHLSKALKYESFRIRGCFGVRRTIVYALGRIGSEEAVFGLIEALSDKDHEVRQNAAVALGKVCSAKILNQFWQLQFKANKVNINDIIIQTQARCQFYNYKIFNSLSLPSKEIPKMFLLCPKILQALNIAFHRLNMSMLLKPILGLWLVNIKQLKNKI